MSSFPGVRSCAYRTRYRSTSAQASESRADRTPLSDGLGPRPTHVAADVTFAASEGALAVGEDAGLPLHRFPLEQTADAHAAVEGGAVGKVLIDVS